MNKIKELREEAGLTLQATADLVDSNPSQISKLERGDRKLTVEWVNKLSTAFGVEPGAIWPMATKGLKVFRVVDVPELDVRAAAGGGTNVEDETQIAKWSLPEPYLIQELHGQPSGCHVITVQGDSMLDENGKGLMPGDKVVVDSSNNVPSPAGLFCLWDGIGVVLKRLEYIEESESIRIISDNPKHRTYERSLGEVSIIGRVILRLTRM